MVRTTWILAVALAAAPPGAAAPPTPEAAAESEARFEFANRLAPFRPMYFSLGLKESLNARFQLSFKYAFVNPDPEPSWWGRTARHLSFAYTQTSVWDLESDSAPFFDTSYRPTVFWARRDVLTEDRTGAVFDLRVGVEHESNGQGGVASRSLNIVYVAPTMRLGETGDLRWSIAPKIYDYIGDLSDNPDIAVYRGHVDLELTVRKPGGIQVKALLRKGKRADYGSVQIDLTYPIPGFSAWLHVQSFSGWGETLRTYDRKLPSEIRVGFAIVR